MCNHRSYSLLPRFRLRALLKDLSVISRLTDLKRAQYDKNVVLIEEINEGKKRITSSRNQVDK